MCIRDSIYRAVTRTKASNGGAECATDQKRGRPPRGGLQLGVGGGGGPPLGVSSPLGGAVSEPPPRLLRLLHPVDVHSVCGQKG
eukprot:8918271-Pyramimonas_sp.AAC.1